MVSAIVKLVSMHTGCAQALDEMARQSSALMITSQLHHCLSVRVSVCLSVTSVPVSRQIGTDGDCVLWIVLTVVTLFSGNSPMCFHSCTVCRMSLTVMEDQLRALDRLSLLLDTFSCY